MKRIVTFVLTAMFLLGSAMCAHAKDLKTAYVDLDRIFEEYNKTRDEYKTLDSKLTKKEEERKKMVDEVRRLKDELELLSDKGKEEKQIEIDDKISALSECDRQATNEFKKERLNAIRDISKDIDKVIQEYAESNSYDYMFSSRALVYGQDKSDITDEIIKLLNKKVTGGKK